MAEEDSFLWTATKWVAGLLAVGLGVKWLAGKFGGNQSSHDAPQIPPQHRLVPAPVEGVKPAATPNVGSGRGASPVK